MGVSCIACRPKEKITADWRASGRRRASSELWRLRSCSPRGEELNGRLRVRYQTEAHHRRDCAHPCNLCDLRLQNRQPSDSRAVGQKYSRLGCRGSHCASSLISHWHAALTERLVSRRGAKGAPSAITMMLLWRCFVNASSALA
eukprot:503527-Rhodomonas_salina.1